MSRRILMLAYACGPEATGEHWLGWGWAREASRLGELHLITTPKYRETVMAAAEKAGVTCHFVAIRIQYRQKQCLLDNYLGHLRMIGGEI